jgi:hypothetical protein
MEEVTVFKTIDKRYFENENEAIAWEESLRWQAVITRFEASSLCPYPNLTSSQNGMMKKIIVAWETFKTGPHA